MHASVSQRKRLMTHKDRRVDVRESGRRQRQARQHAPFAGRGLPHHVGLSAGDDVEPVRFGPLPGHHVAAREGRMHQAFGDRLALAFVQRGEEIDVRQCLQPSGQILSPTSSSATEMLASAALRFNAALLLMDRATCWTSRLLAAG